MSALLLGAAIGALFWIAAYCAGASFLELVAARIDHQLGHF